MHDDLLTIGQLARLSGLTVKALRHDDRVGLLEPVSIDGHTAYRRYEGSRVERAREIRRLRDLDLPLDGIRRVLDGDPGEARAILEHQRAVIEAETFRLQRIGHRLRMMTTKEGTSMTDTGPGTTTDAAVPPNDGPLDPAQQREVAVELFNLVWNLLERSDRTESDDDRMLHAAHASRYHWGEVGAAEQQAVGEWQCSRVYAVLGRGEPALHHAGRVLDIARSDGVPEWVGASGMEAMARASAVTGDEAAAAEWTARARSAAMAIEDEDKEDREVVLGDIATLPIGDEIVEER